MLLPIKTHRRNLIMALKAVKKKSNVTPLFTADDIGKLGKEYAEISAQIKQLEERKKALAEKIKEGAEQFGVKDDKGSFYLENDTVIMGKVAKKSFKIDQEKAVDMLKDLGVEDVIDVITTKVVNEDRLQIAVQEGRLSLDTVEEFTNVNVSYSVSVKEKEAMPEVEVTSAKAARRK